MSSEPSTHKVIELASRSSLELDVAALFEESQFSLYPHVEERGLVFLSFRKGKVVLSAGAFIGLVPLTSKLSLEIVPKLPVKNLGRIFETARGSLGRLRDVSRTYAVRPGGEGVLEFVITNLVDAVQQIETEGYAKRYGRQTHRSSQPKGRLLLRETLGECTRRGRIHSVVAEHFEQTADTIANRIIKAALKKALAIIRSDGSFGANLLSEAARLYMRIPNEVRELKNAEYSEIVRELASPGGVEHRYERAVSTALMLLNGHGISLDQSGFDQSLSSYILNLEEIFEDYLRRSLQPRMISGYLVMDGNREARKPLYTGRLLGPFAQPDMVVMSAGMPHIIAEVKYKTKVDRADINQAVTYAVAYGVKHTVLVHAASTKAQAGPYDIGNVGDVRVSAFAFDLGSDELEREESRLARYLCGHNADDTVKAPGQR